MLVLSFTRFLSLQVLEGGSLGVHVDFGETKPILYLDTHLGDFLLNEVVCTVEPLRESLVSIYDSEAMFWWQFTIIKEPVPYLSRYEEVVATDFAFEWVGWNYEVSISKGEVIVPSSILVKNRSPGWVVFRGEDWVFRVLPGIFETFNRINIFFETHGNDKVIVANSSAITKDDSVFLRQKFIDSHCIWVGSVIIDSQSCIWKVLSFGSSLLLVDTPHRVGLVDTLVVNHHDFIFSVRNFIEMSR